MDEKSSKESGKRLKGVPNGTLGANFDDFTMQNVTDSASAAEVKKKRSNYKKASSFSSSQSSEKSSVGNCAKQKLTRNKTTSSYADSNKGRAERKTELNQDANKTTSNISEKLNLSDNIRNTNKNRRASIPNSCSSYKGASSATPDVSPTSRESTSSKSESSKSKLPVRLPDYKNSPNKGKSFSVKSGSLRNVKFEPYIPLFQIQQGLKRGEFIEGALRINPRNYEDAYVNSPDGQMDIYIGGMHNRNRALNGDTVVVQVNPKQEWKVLRDAIKEHQEKSGGSITDSIYRPTPSPPPPCKVHTPDRLQRSRPVSAASWNSTYGEDRPPDTLKILGFDKLAKQFDDLSIDSRKRMNVKKKYKRTKDSNGERSNSSLSQESSEEALDKLSPNLGDLSDIQSVSIITDKDSTHGSKNEDGSAVNSSSLDYAPHPACDMNQIGTFDCTIEEDLCGSSWKGEQSTLNIVISPEELLSIDGNSILDLQTQLDDSGSEIDGIIVPPGELSGDEFTDSASITSSHSNTLDQTLEDASFLACQQDADNNNMTLNEIVCSEMNRMGYSTFIPTSSITTQHKPLELDCRFQESINSFSISNFDGNSDTVVCSIISDTSLQKEPSSSDENANDNLIAESQCLDHATNLDQPTAPTNVKKKPKRKRKKKGKNKQNNAVIATGEKETSDLIKILNLTVDEVMKHPLWEKFIQKTGKVVHILERKHSLTVAGHLKLCPDRSSKWALFSPNDSRIPRIMVPMSDCPQNFYHRPGDYASVIFLAEIIDWSETSTFANGRLIKSLGNSGDIEVETEALLVVNGVDTSEFSPEVMKCLPQEDSWYVPPEEFILRKDFRKQCLYTIDPASARDMDDAVSSIRLDNGNFEVGVHIADVTYFVKEDTALDEIARSRSTSVYLVEKVIPMLPRLLCDNLCSLAPGTDRLAFSIVWEMTPEGEIVSQWIGRSVIHSCVKLSYEHAQSMIDNPGKSWDSDEFPQLFGNFSINEVAVSVHDLYLLSLCLQKKRFDHGALRLDQVKLQFTLDSQSGLPTGFNAYERKDSNSLIEEFMLLANMSVAKHIYAAFPEQAMLRRHPPPQPKPMEDAVSTLKTLGYDLDTTDSGTLHNSIMKYKGNDFTAKAATQLIINICAKPMNCALYFCTGVVKKPSLFHHFALNVPLYTHFTSPIRRYPDIVVHRLLSASLGYSPVPSMEPREMGRCANHCNDKKCSAKIVSEASGELFLAAFIREVGSIPAKAMVVGAMDNSVDCLVLEVGIVKRAYCDKLPLLKKEFKRTGGVSQLKIVWEDSKRNGGFEQTLAIFSSIDVILTVEPNTLRIRVTLKKPEK